MPQEDSEDERPATTESQKKAKEEAVREQEAGHEFSAVRFWEREGAGPREKTSMKKISVKMCVVPIAVCVIHLHFCNVSGIF